ncbi:MAG: type II toxin-antitoxin system MqsA family antitoxin [Parvibaculum sp.]|uniref:type II TA system antitoxin MqsA family protein n=1 Tax=Parvibaculum sp. TaxID=2024848 RepID=UPI002728D932|nr:type II TA system antitoxin MqsA family protein [Parvibaculum sp.]MDO8838748.1 type II toxin-antitoxin system MqsA family antitoxin [Parvibaculum sp.]
MKKGEQQPSAQGPMEDCALCGENAATQHIRTQQFAYREGTNEVLLNADIPVIECAACGETYTAESAEEAQHDAVCRHLERLTPDEIRALRDRNGLTQARLAELTGIGIASIKRWEAGNVIQNAALDAALRALDAAHVKVTKPRPVPRFRTTFSQDTLRRARSFDLRFFPEEVAA